MPPKKKPLSHHIVRETLDHYRRFPEFNTGGGKSLGRISLVGRVAFVRKVLPHMIGNETIESICLNPALGNKKKAEEICDYFQKRKMKRETAIKLTIRIRNNIGQFVRSLVKSKVVQQRVVKGLTSSESAELLNSLGHSGWSVLEPIQHVFYEVENLLRKEE